MFDFFSEAISYVFVNLIFEGILLNVWRGVRLVGFYILHLITGANRSFADTKESFKDSSIPYFIGFTLVIGAIYLLVAFSTQN